VEPVKVVARYQDGKRIKGFSQDFFGNKDRFHIYPATKPPGDAVEVLVQDLKALFFVRDFAGNYQYNERKGYMEGERPSGRKIEVTFKDGEVMTGSTLGYEPNRPGFFIFPADPKCNNIRVYVVSNAVKRIRFL
jgi:hypothetical protein